MISPYAKTNYIDHHATEQASITKFIENNWFRPRLGDGSFVDFIQSNNERVLLGTNGSVQSITPIRGGRRWLPRRSSRTRS